MDDPFLVDDVEGEAYLDEEFPSSVLPKLHQNIRCAVTFLLKAPLAGHLLSSGKFRLGAHRF